MLGFAVPVEDINAHAHYRPVPAIYGRAPVAEGGPLPCFGGAGTGGVEGLHFVMSRQGYRPYAVVNMDVAAAQESYAPYTDLMKEVKVGFEILKSLGLRTRGVQIISCPSCARQGFDVIKTVEALEQRLGVRLQPPVLGQHTVELMEELGYTGEQVQALRAQGAVA